MSYPSNIHDDPTRIERSPFERMRQQQDEAITRDRAERTHIEQNQRNWERDESDRGERERDRWRQ